MPRFQQLFFYEFRDWEVYRQENQPSSSSSSLRAAGAYLISGIRLESMCGVSDVWYRYVESHQAFYSGGKIQALPLQQYIYHPCPRPDRPHEKYLWSVFQWKKMHSRPQPRKKKPHGHKSSPASPSSSESGIVQVSDRESEDFSLVMDDNETPTPLPQRTERISKHTKVEGGGFCEDSSDEEAREKTETISEYTEIERGGVHESLSDEEAPEKIEGISEYAEIKQGGFCENPSDEETGERAGQDMAEVSGSAGMQLEGSAPTQVKMESPEFVFDELPTNASFSEALNEAFAVAEGLTPSSVPGERGLSHHHVNSSRRAVSHTHVENPAGEGVRSGQPGHVLVYASDAEGSDAEGAAEMDVDYTADSEWQGCIGSIGTC